MFWFETGLVGAAAQVRGQRDVRDGLPPSDQPAPRSGSFAPSPAEVIRRDTEIVGEAVMRKVLQDNACRVYHIG